jgi:hypothetical protein
MPTEKQIAANRRNALKSTGPRTAEGKARSSRNAAKTAFSYDELQELARPSSPLALLAADFRAHYRPDNPIEIRLIDYLIASTWRIRQSRKLEKCEKRTQFKSHPTL